MKVKELVSRINLPARASMAYLGASVIGKAIGILTTPFFTRLISEEEYGALTLYMTILGGASVICSAVSSGSAVYRGFKNFENKSGEFTKSVLRVSIGFSLVFCLVLFAFLPLLGLDRKFYIPLFVQILCDSIVGVALARARFRYKYVEVMAVGILSSALPAFVSLSVIQKTGCGCAARIYSLLFVSLTVSLFELFRISRLSGRAERKMMKYMLRAAIPLLPHSISVALSGQVDKLFITRIMGNGALAKYAVVHSLGIALQFAVTALGSALGPWMIRRLDSGEKERIAKVVLTIFSLFCAVSLGLCLIAPEAMKLLAPSKYLEALPALIPIALSTPLSLLSYVITVGLVHAEKGRYTAMISVVNMAVCITLNYILISPLGYLGAGLALLLSQLSAVLVGLICLYRVKLSEILLPSRAAGYFGLCLAFGVITALLYGHTSLRVILLILPAILGIRGLIECKNLVTEIK